MTDHKTIYQQEAERYDRMVMREDKDHQLMPAIEKIISLKGIDAVELGAGTGRLSTQIAPLVSSLKMFDLSESMLAVAGEKLQELGIRNWQIHAADHRNIPLESCCADLVLSGWSVCYLNDKDREDWQVPFLEALAEIKRLLRPIGKIILIETEGTGTNTPNPPDSMHNYLKLLREQGFSFDWIRTDYLFESWAEVKELVPFFFGEEMLEQCFEAEGGVVLPECTGIWSWSKTD